MTGLNKWLIQVWFTLRIYGSIYQIKTGLTSKATRMWILVIKWHTLSKIIYIFEYFITQRFLTSCN
jgi:hypothetical protein